MRCVAFVASHAYYAGPGRGMNLLNLRAGPRSQRSRSRIRRRPDLRKPQNRFCLSVRQEARAKAEAKLQAEALRSEGDE